MFDGLILMFGGQLISDTNFQILLMVHVFSCVYRSRIHDTNSHRIVSRMVDKLYEISNYLISSVRLVI